MANIDVIVTDAAETRRQEVSMPADVPLNRIVAVLVDKLGLPQQSPDGAPMSYKFHHKESSRQLADTLTLIAAGVHAHDTLRLMPQITAG